MNRFIHRAFLGTVVTLATVVGCDDRERTTRTVNPNRDGVVDPVVPDTDPLATPRDDTDPTRQPVQPLPPTDPIQPRQPGERDPTTLPKQPTQDPTQPQSSDKSKTGEAQPNREALGYLIVINRNETDAVNAAMKKDLREPVQEFAKMIQADHIKNFDETMNLGQKISGLPVQNEEATQMRSKHDEKLKQMAQLNGPEFEREFVNAMVKSHTEALATIEKAMKNVDNEAVKAHLEGSHRAITEHLKHAKQLQQLSGQGANDKAQPLDEKKLDEQK